MSIEQMFAVNSSEGREQHAIIRIKCKRSAHGALACDFMTYDAQTYRPNAHLHVRSGFWMLRLKYSTFGFQEMDGISSMSSHAAATAALSDGGASSAPATPKSQASSITSSAGQAYSTGNTDDYNLIGLRLL